MTRSLGTLAALASLTAIPLAMSARGGQGPLRMTTYGVRVDVLVTSGGRPVSGLRAEDFDVVDAGVPQHVEAAQAVSHVAVAFVLDTSASAHAAGFERFARAGGALVGSLDPADLAALVTCSDHLSLAVPLTDDRALLRRALAASPGFSGTVSRSMVWDALFGAAGVVARDSGRPLVVLISDGLDNASWLSRTEVGRRLAEANVLIDFVRSEARSASADFPSAGPVRPDDVARATGGEVYNISDTKLAQRFKAHLDELRQAYVLTYQPRGVKTDDGWHAVKVRVRGRSLTVKARPGYLGELEQLVLLAVIQLDDEAYGVAIQQLLATRANRNVALPTVYTTIDRLETKGVLEVRLGDSTPERGGRRKRLCRATTAGLRALKQSMASTRALTQGLSREFRP